MSESLCLGNDGWLICNTPWVRHSPSPNFDERPADSGQVDLIVVHAISLPPNDFSSAAVELFFHNQLDPNAHPYFRTIASVRVSAHFFIRRTGEVIQFVSTSKRAWHAGVSSWHGRQRCNDFSLGIELEGGDEIAFESIQYERLNALIAALHHDHGVTEIVGHSDIASGRKTDPGPCFDWTRVLSVPRKFA
ncbi:MAG: 1,6-anhydro-N-acetylmuramyl-L-alanine amidase AmpD [Rhodocyclaceae bacterium]|nr:1,6-anhydro-N-acetylmuramyl-L-alanine amidase AmpD [Rhodocyclaceae bacterium]MBK6908198.1 1,6-anhydro-N-acetylmuramyl-L-alanine amidase AmpD [Rhodocyclaceae bacterium]